jgi:hypothetical protein
MENRYVLNIFFFHPNHLYNLNFFKLYFTALVIAKSMDIRFAGLNFQGLETVRTVQDLGRREQGVIPSPSTVRRDMSKLECYMRSEYGLFGISGLDSAKNEVMTTPPEPLLRYLIKSYGLQDIAQVESIDMCITYDGAQLTKKVGHVTCGFKMCDSRSINPSTGSPIFEGAGYQSVDHCHPVCSVVGKEQRKVLEESFGPIYSFCKKVSNEGLPASKLGPAIKKINFIAPNDGKGTIQLVNRGGGAKVCQYFCPYCSITSAELISTRPEYLTCSKCLTSSPTNHQCRHWAMEDQEYMDKCQLDIERSEYKYFISEAFKVQLKATTTAHPLICSIIRDAASNESHIDFQYSTCAQMKVLKKFFKLISSHIRIRKEQGILNDLEMSNETTAEGIKAFLDKAVPQLKMILKQEEKIHHMHVVIKRDLETREHYLIEPWKCCVDIMHLFNRTIEKIIRILFIRGMQKTVNQSKYMKDVEEAVNNNNMMDPSTFSLFPNRSKWVFPKAPGPGLAVGDVNMGYKEAKKFLEKIHVLYDLCLSDSPDRQCFEATVTLFKEILDICEKKDPFSDDDISSLQEKMDKFGHDWIALTGIDGIGNYFHYLICGHVTYFLKRYRNLYR